MGGSLGRIFLAAATGGVSEAVRGISRTVKAAGKGGPESPIPLPQPPGVSGADETAQEKVRRKKVALSKSVYTSPLGVAGEAQVARKTLLGQ